MAKLRKRKLRRVRKTKRGLKLRTKVKRGLRKGVKKTRKGLGKSLIKIGRRMSR